MPDKMYFTNGVLKRKDGDIRQGVGSQTCCCEDVEGCRPGICVSGTESGWYNSHFQTTFFDDNFPFGPKIEMAWGRNFDSFLYKNFNTVRTIIGGPNAGEQAEYCGYDSPWMEDRVRYIDSFYSTPQQRSPPWLCNDRNHQGYAWACKQVGFFQGFAPKQNPFPPPATVADCNNKVGEENGHRTNTNLMTSNYSVTVPAPYRAGNGINTQCGGSSLGGGMGLIEGMSGHHPQFPDDRSCFHNAGLKVKFKLGFYNNLQLGVQRWEYWMTVQWGALFYAPNAQDPHAHQNCRYNQSGTGQRPFNGQGAAYTTFLLYINDTDDAQSGEWEPGDFPVAPPSTGWQAVGPKIVCAPGHAQYPGPCPWDGSGPLNFQYDPEKAGCRAFSIIRPVTDPWLEITSAFSFHDGTNAAPWCVPGCWATGIPVYANDYYSNLNFDYTGTNNQQPDGPLLFLNIQAQTQDCDGPATANTARSRNWPENTDGAAQAIAASDSFNITYAPEDIEPTIPSATAWAKSACPGVEADLVREQMLYGVTVNPGNIGFG